MTTREEYTFDRVIRIIFTIALFIGAIWIVGLLKNVLLPFFVACLIAYLFEPFVQHNRRLLHLKGRVAAIFITLFEAIFLLGIALYFIGPIVMDEVHEMANIMRTYADTELNGSIIPKEVHDFLKRCLDFKSLSETLTRQEWMSIIERSLITTWDVISGSITLVLSFLNWLLVILYVVFIMIDYERLGRGFRRLVPPAYSKVVFTLASDIKHSMNHYFRGQATVAMIVGVMFAIGFSIIDMPLAIVFGLFIGILNLVPYLQLISIVPAAALCIISSASGETELMTISLECIAVYCIVQIIQDLYLVPRIMGKEMGLNPAVILLSLSIWGTLFGFIGLIIALPLTTLLLSYYNRYIIRGNKDIEDESDEKSKQTETPESSEKQ